MELASAPILAAGTVLWLVIAVWLYLRWRRFPNYKNGDFIVPSHPVAMPSPIWRFELFYFLFNFWLWFCPALLAGAIISLLYIAKNPSVFFVMLHSASDILRLSKDVEQPLLMVVPHSIFWFLLVFVILLNAFITLARLVNCEVCCLYRPAWAELLSLRLLGWRKYLKLNSETDSRLKTHHNYLQWIFIILTIPCFLFRGSGIDLTILLVMFGILGLFLYLNVPVIRKMRERQKMNGSSTRLDTKKTLTFVRRGKWRNALIAWVVAPGIILVAAPFLPVYVFTDSGVRHFEETKLKSFVPWKEIRSLNLEFCPTHEDEIPKKTVLKDARQSERIELDSGAQKFELNRFSALSGDPAQLQKLINLVKRKDVIVACGESLQ